MNDLKITAYHHRFGKLAIQHDILERMSEEFSWRGGVVILVILPSLEEVKRRLLTLGFVPFIAFIWKIIYQVINTSNVLIPCKQLIKKISLFTADIHGKSLKDLLTATILDTGFSLHQTTQCIHVDSSSHRYTLTCLDCLLSVLYCVFDTNLKTTFLY